jgi:hypothetical protein
MITAIYAMTTEIRHDEIRPVTFYEVDRIDEFWDAYQVVFSSFPATLHFSMNDAMDFVDEMEEAGNDTAGVLIRQVRMPPLKKFVQRFLNVHKGREADIEFKPESKQE